MLRVRHFLMALPLALFPLGCAPAGCSGEDPEQDKPANEQFIGAVEQTLPAPVPGALLYGTWAGDLTGVHFSSLVLMTDGRFHYEQAVTCVKAPCPPVVRDGTYKLYARESRTFIEFGDRDPMTTERYEYAVAAKTLRLRPLVPGSEWYSMARSETAWCGSDRDCNVQNLPPGVCSGQYLCGKHACTWQCAGLGEPAAVDEQGTTATP